MKTLILRTLLFLSLISCNEQAIYQKEYLEGVGVPEKTLLDIPVPASFTTDNSDFPIHNPDLADKVESVPSSEVVGDVVVPNTQIVVNEEIPETTNSTDSTPTAPIETTPILPVDPTPSVLLADKSDSFIQKQDESSKVDILWVIDNSGSMQNEQEALAANFDSFISEFLTKNIDFNMAITTTDGRPAKDGRMVWGLDKKLNTEYAKTFESHFLRTFKQLVNVGTKGSGKEMGLNATKAFMELYVDRFRRADAKLAVIVLSDEEDQSNLPVASYVNLLGNDVKFYTIISRGEPLVAPESIGYRYMEAARLTNGVIASIKDNFNTVMNDFGSIIVKSLRSFTLSQKPADASTIRVYVDGTLRVSGWSYNEAQIEISFDEGSIPSANQTIKVDYQVVQ